MQLSDFPLQTFDKIRYSDTDRQGHVNNTVFSAFLETGRVEMIYNENIPVLSQDCSFVIASLHLSFLAEVQWPGQVDIGTCISKIGNSSIHFFQRVFHSLLVAEAKTIVVQVDNNTKKSAVLSQSARDVLAQFQRDLPDA